MRLIPRVARKVNLLRALSAASILFRRCFLSAALLAGLAVPAAAAEQVLVFAAASTTEVVSRLAERFTAETGIAVKTAFAASSLLARQIENGAPADLYISADRRWMDELAARGLVDPASRCNLFGNRLALIAPIARPFSLVIEQGFPLAAALGRDRLAIADPDHVPAGLYAREALTRLGVWRAVAPYLVRAADVRAALALVDRGEVAAGIVYATDAAISERVRVVGIFPPESHAPIVYPAARLARSTIPAATDFLAYLSGPTGRSVARTLGFTTALDAACPS